jgi:hypothetical protein
VSNPFGLPLQQIREASYVDPDSDRKKKYRVRPPATTKLRGQIAKWAKDGRVPAELDAFLGLTSGFDGAGITVDFKQAFTGATGVLAVYDYGNGDCLGLDDEGDRCTVWWIGHDPYGVIFVADSLLEYVTRFAEVAQRGDHENDDLIMVKPERQLEPITAAEARQRGADAALDALDDAALVFDFRGAAPRTHVDLPRIPKGSHTQRLGRLLTSEKSKPRPDAEHARKVEYLVELAFGLITMEQFDEARTALAKALELDPASERAKERMAWLEARVAKGP